MNRTYSFCVALLLTALLSATPVTLLAAITASPHGIAVRAGNQDPINEHLALSNGGDQAFSFQLKTVAPRNRDAVGPQRDDPTDLVILILKGPDDGGYGWADDNTWLEVFNNQAQAITRDNINNIANLNLNDYDLVCTGEDQSAGFYQAFTDHRNQISDYVSGGGLFAIFAGSNSFQAINLFKDGGNISVSRGPGGDWADVNPGFVNQGGNGLREGIEEDLPILTPYESFRDDQGNADKVRIHMRGNSLNFATIQQGDLPEGGVWYYRPQGDGNGDKAILADYPYGSGYVLFTGTSGTLFYRNNWSWSSGMECVNLTKWADGRLTPRWFVVDPSEGNIAGGGNQDISAVFSPGNLAEGVYRLDLQVIDGQAHNVVLTMPILLTVGARVGSISGTITSAGDNQPIANASVTVSPYNFIPQSDGNGHYTQTNLPEGAYTLRVTAPDYLPANRADVQVRGNQDADGSLTLLHATCDPTPREINEQLAPGTDSHVNFTVTNDGNGPLTYTVEERLLGDANAAPWDVRKHIDIGNLLRDDRLEGVAFDGTFFYVSGPAGADANTIYVLNRDGEYVRRFNQPGNSANGMKDLEYGGGLLWGSGEQQVYGFTTDGEVVHHWNGPFNPNYNIAYDTDHDWLWISATTTDPTAYTVDGQLAHRGIGRRNLRIYGLAYYPDDPDGYNLYVFSNPVNNVQVIHKMRTSDGDTMRALRTFNVQSGNAAGIFITNLYDVYSWVVMTMIRRPLGNGGALFDVYQLAARRDWFHVRPTQGVIAAGQTQQYDLHLDAAGWPEVQLQSQLIFHHDGRGGSTTVPINLDVVNGPVHSERTISLSRGWNLVSANLQPDPAGIPVIVAPLVENGSFIMMKNGFGRFYSPVHNLNNIERWNVDESYLVKMAAPGQIRVEGMTIMPDHQLNLAAGWNAIPFCPRRNMDAPAAFAGLGNNLTIAKNGNGEFYLPSRGFNSMAPLTEGQGYQVRLSEASAFVYGGGRFAGEIRKFASINDHPSSYQAPVQTGSNMSVLVRSDGLEGDIGVYAGDRLVGVGIIDRGLAGIAVWGDDPATIEVDGATINEPLSLFLRNGNGERQLTATIVGGDLRYVTDGLAITEVSIAAAPANFGLSEVYPNPFNGRTTVTASLERDGFTKIALFDLAGRNVGEVFSGNLIAGQHRFSVNAELLSTGVYILRMESTGRSSQMKLALIK